MKLPNLETQIFFNCLDEYSDNKKIAPAQPQKMTKPIQDTLLTGISGKVKEDIIVYIHGFASSSQSKKVQALKERFGSAIISFDLHHEPKKAIEQLEKFIQSKIKNCNITLIGSSLGGFYSLYLSGKYI
jgi:hypothetical protein